MEKINFKDNPLFNYKQMPAFDVIKPKHAEEAVPILLETATEKFKELEESSVSDWQELFGSLQDLEEPVDYAWGIVGHFMSVMNSDDWRAVHEKLQPEVVHFSLMCGQSKSLYKKMVDIAEGEEFDGLTSAQKRILESSLRGANFSGVGLEGDDKEAFNVIQKELSKRSTSFSNNLLDATNGFSMLLRDKTDVKGLPVSLLESSAVAAVRNGHDGATADQGPWVITLDGPCFTSFMKFSENAQLREKLYRAYVTKASSGKSDNRQNIVEILKLRREKSALLGFKNYAEQSVASKMAPSVEAIEGLLEDLRSASYPYAEDDFSELNAFAKQDAGVETLLNWDIPYWSEKRKKALYDYNEEDLRPYFQFSKVLTGMFELADNIFDINIESADGTVAVWHEDVKYFVVKDAAGKMIASFFLDPYVRPGLKRDGAWMNSLWGLDMKKPEVQLPVAYIVCNQSRPTETRPSLMTFSDVNTIFHEFGHALQHMLTKVDEPFAAGINNVEWDAVELASQFMENWCYEKDVATSLSCHFETGKSLPDELFERVYKSKNYMAGSAMLRQLYFGILDMNLHDADIADYDDVMKIKKQAAQSTTVIPPIKNDRFLCSFGHIFAGGYAAGYYSYKWAEVLSADAFAAFEEAGLDDEAAIWKVGLKFRNTVLALGGSESPMDVFEMFRGRKPSIDALLRHSGLK
ncbi:MAG: M3 family metallopeptidase [Kiritimatiellae bacterium]|nr:M3 family metallopeptidase [Kiritimatiellia bacterium]